jgi:hypothetical protein
MQQSKMPSGPTQSAVSQMLAQERQAKLQQEPLAPETGKRLGNKSPELVWLEIQAAFSRALDEEPEAVEKLAKPKQLRPDELMDDLMSARRIPHEWMLNTIAESNPSLDLQQIPSLPPLQLVEALFNAVMNPEHEYSST